MAAFRSLVFAAALAGLAAGLFLTVAQQLGTVPLILRAEVYERAADAASADRGHGGGAHEHAGEGEAWAPRDGFERVAFTALANVVIGVGFALLLVAGYGLRGRAIGWRAGLWWGMAGFVIFTAAPSLGLPPELPGMPAAPLGPRQVWWALTAAATAGGLALLAFRPSPAGVAVAVALLLAPHLLGAPRPAEANALPETLVHDFVVAVTVTSFLFWLVLGLSTALLFRRFGADQDPSFAG